MDLGKIGREKDAVPISALLAVEKEYLKSGGLCPIPLEALRHCNRGGIIAVIAKRFLALLWTFEEVVDTKARTFPEQG